MTVMFSVLTAVPAWLARCMGRAVTVTWASRRACTIVGLCADCVLFLRSVEKPKMSMKLRGCRTDVNSRLGTHGAGKELEISMRHYSLKYGMLMTHLPDMDEQSKSNAMWLLSASVPSTWPITHQHSRRHRVALWIFGARLWSQRQVTAVCAIGDAIPSLRRGCI
ncbi:hypothetical protein SISSUDRAFT_633686 [Sistotremastrum suecicum HHB10207 ss-3]|uniref:Uncharacterized protein n=1 Tax=Sistotremastrum suecicum HHB10207 ss-3 TaxID=1314776 RepID=A0A166EDB2_9AGAM|nr:hypothetical protein SISSUDRAFT_633686 [Sistotremastrum suecicum HHB10207 ss-3]